MLAATDEGRGTTQQTRVAERSRLTQADLFEPHTTHEELVNHTDEHQRVAAGGISNKEEAELQKRI